MQAVGRKPRAGQPVLVVAVSPSLDSEPNRHSFRIKPDARADPKGRDSIRFGEFVNDDRRDSQEDSELPGICVNWRSRLCHGGCGGYLRAGVKE